MLNVGGQQVIPSQTMKYLGVVFDSKLKYIDHVDYINQKVRKTIAKLAIVFQNTFGYGNTARRIMVKGCMKAIYLYASVVWGSALRYQSVIKSIRATQRKTNSICARAYKDVGYEISSVLAGMPPLDMVIEKRIISYSVRKKYFPVMWTVMEPFDIPINATEKALQIMLNQRLLESWNKLYMDNVPVNHWCRTLIPSVEWAVRCMELRPNFLLAQAVMGHGAFNSYLFKIGKRTSPNCKCGLEVQTPEHVFKTCVLYSESRPDDWSEGLSSESVRQYLIRATKQLWEEEKEEEKSGLNRVRRIRSRAGVPNTGAGPAPSSR